MCGLSRHGRLRVRVLERAGVVGGACVTEEFHPGFRNSTAAYTVSLLQAKVIADLKLQQHGLRIVERRAQNFLPLPDGRYLLTADGRTESEIAKFSATDAERYPAYQAEIGRIAAVCAAPCSRRRPIWCLGISRIAYANSARSRRSAKGYGRTTASRLRSACSASRPATSWMAGSTPIRSRHCSASTRSWAIWQAPIRRAPAMCCCITYSAK